MTDWTFGLIPGLIGDAFSSDNSTPTRPTYTPASITTNPYAQYAAQLNALQPGSYNPASVSGPSYDPHAPVTDSSGVLRGGRGSNYYSQGNPYTQYAPQLSALQSGGMLPAPQPQPQQPQPSAQTPPPLNIHPGANNPYANFDFSQLSYNPSPSPVAGLLNQGTNNAG